MKVIFGLHLDGPTAPDGLADGEALSGEAAAGPDQLLSILETRLGLAGVWQPASVRLMEYLARVEAAAEAAPLSCSASLRTDPLGTAALLLRWRDELMTCGWNGATELSSSRRLKDLSAVERVAMASDLPLAPGRPERMRAVIHALGSRHAGIQVLSLVDLLDNLPPAWTEVVSALDAQGTELEGLPEPPGADEGNLRLLQGRELPGSVSPPSEADLSVVFLEAESDSEAAAALALHLEEPDLQTLILAPDGDDTLVRACRSRGIAMPSARIRSPFRPALQVLPLAVALRWAPLDPHGLHQFLSLNVSPLPIRVARKLAPVVAGWPGLAGPNWNRAIAELKETFPSPEDEKQLAGAPAEHRNLDWLLKTWLDPDRVDPDRGMNRGDLRTICGEVARWAKVRQVASLSRGEPTGGTFGAVVGHASTLQEMLDLSRRDCVNRQLWESMLDRALGEGEALQEARAELESVPMILHPGALIGPVERLVWWDFTDAGALAPSMSPWTPAERAELTGLGLELPHSQLQYRQLADATRRAIQATGRQLVLVRPALRRGKKTQPHPEEACIVARLEKGNPVPHLAAASQTLHGADAKDEALLEKVNSRNPPRRRRWWHLDSGVRLMSDQSRSYSALESCVRCPADFVLDRIAGIREGALQPVTSLSRLLGNVSHRLLQECLQEEEFLTSGHEEGWIEAWLGSRITPVLQQEGALLLMDRYRGQRHGLETSVARAGRLLAREMRAGGWRLVRLPGKGGQLGCEVRLEGTLDGLPVHGNLDLFFERDGGEHAVVDMKWRARKDTGDIPLQLLVYGQLARLQAGQWPRLALLFIQEGRFQPDLPLSSARPAGGWDDGRCGEELAECAATIHWRQSLLAEGWIESPVPGTDPDIISHHPSKRKRARPANIPMPGEEHRIPPEARPVETLYPYPNFVTLMGWADGGQDSGEE